MQCLHHMHRLLWFPRMVNHPAPWCHIPIRCHFHFPGWIWVLHTYAQFLIWCLGQDMDPALLLHLAALNHQHCLHMPPLIHSHWLIARWSYPTFLKRDLRRLWRRSRLYKIKWKKMKSKNGQSVKYLHHKRQTILQAARRFFSQRPSAYTWASIVLALECGPMLALQARPVLVVEW